MSYIGSNKVGTMYLGTTKIAKAYLGDDLVYNSSGEDARILPSGFVECEYIQNTYQGEGAYINTGITSSSELRVVAKIQNGLDSSYPMMYGVRHANMTKRFECFAYTSYVHSFAISGSAYGTAYRSTNTSPHTIDVNKYRVIYDDVEYQSSSNDTWTGTLPFIICGYATSDGNGYGCPSSVKYYYFKIYNGNVLVRDFVPAYKSSTQKYGLYDFVSKTFFSSARSGKEFTGQQLTT